MTKDETRARVAFEAVRAQQGRIVQAQPDYALSANTPENAIGHAMHYSRSHDAVIRVYDAAGNVTETHEHKGDFKEW